MANTIKVAYVDREGIFRRQAFNGEWIVEDLNCENGFEYSVALTGKGSILIFEAVEFSQEACIHVEPSFEKLKNKRVYPSRVIAAIAEALDEEYEEFLDI